MALFKRKVKKTTKKPAKKKVVKKVVKRKGSKNAFGTYRIRPDATLGAVLGTTKPVKPSEMTKLIWKYIKKKNLGGS
ncbi:MAG: hypothetical protein KJ906_03650 [Nanoarchaeota archaeon]|nr:hypothetical protein [Nanoarchaeota archaeon]